jgi:hypothetical protein
MKALLVLLSLVASTAMADMKGPFSFVPFKCGNSAQGSICFGTRVGVEGKYVSVSDGRSKAVVFQVVKTTPINGGINPMASAQEMILANGQATARCVVRGTNGTVDEVTVTLPSGKTITVGAMARAVTTM